MRYGCGTALAIFTALLVTAVLVIMQWMHAGATPATRTAPETISGSVVLLDDGRTIAYSDPNTLCGSASLAAAQTRTRVVLSLHANYEPNCRGFGLGPSQSSPVSPLDPAAAIWQPGWADPNMPGSPITVTLASPLSGRRLQDAVTGKVIPYFDQGAALSFHSPGWGSAYPWLPNGDVSSDVPYFGGPGAAVLADNLIGIDRRTKQPDGWSLTIVQVTGGGWHPPPGTVTRHVIVRGHHGLAAAGIIVWTEDRRTIAVIGQGPAGRLPGVAGTAGRTPMPLAKLLDIANALAGGT